MKWRDVYIYTPNKPERRHLAVVTEAMRALGPPTIRALWAGPHWEAIEGSHRVAAAHALGVAPAIEEVTENELVEHDIDGIESPATVREIFESGGERLGGAYRFATLSRA